MPDFPSKEGATALPHSNEPAEENDESADDSQLFTPVVSFVFKNPGLSPGAVIDGYELIRQIGQGGFGTVWLVRSTVTGNLQALKYVKPDNPRLLEKESQAVERFKRAASRLSGAQILPIEHVNYFESGLLYVMPLSDGCSKENPLSSKWRPDTLAERIIAQREQEHWFTSEQVVEWIAPLADAVAGLTAQGLIHRDIKPENILFINGKPYLGDISLLTDDGRTISHRGTPGYSAPSWYLDSGGHPDLWGLASTLFAVLSGNPPDRIGRAAFLWPPQGREKMSHQQQCDWDYFHAITLRATSENANDRFVQITDVSTALRRENDISIVRPVARSSRRKGSIAAILLGVAAVLITGWKLNSWQPSPASSPAEAAEPASRLRPDFKRKFDAGVKEFEDKIAQLEKRFIAESMPNVEKYQRLLEKLEEMTIDDQKTFTATISELQVLIPDIKKETAFVDHKVVNDAFLPTYAMLDGLKDLPENPEEGFYASRFIDKLHKRRTVVYEGSLGNAIQSKLTKNFELQHETQKAISHYESLLRSKLKTADGGKSASIQRDINSVNAAKDAMMNLW